MWCQAARCKWLKEGDANTSFFHKITNMKTRRNMINSLYTECRFISDEGEKKDHVYSYFKKIFGEKPDLRLKLTT